MINEPFHDLGECAPGELFIDVDNGPQTTDYGYLFLSYKKGLDRPCLIEFHKSYAIGSFITKADYPLRDWYIVELLCYNLGGLHIQQSKYIYMRGHGKDFS